MSRKAKHWVVANLAAAACALCLVLWLRHNGSNLMPILAAINFALVWINIKGALRS